MGNQSTVKQHCNDDIDNCMRYCASLIISVIITISGIFYIIKTYSRIGRISFEIIPMCTSVFQAFLHVIQFSWVNNNQITLIANYFQIITFALVGECFRYAHRKIQQSEYSLLFNQQRKLNFSSYVYLAFFVFQIISIALTSPLNCNYGFYMSLSSIFLQIVVTIGIITRYGIKLQKQITLITDKYEQDILQIQLPLEKIRQIQILVYSLIFNSIIYILILFIIYYKLGDLLCDFELTNISPQANLLLAFFTLTQLLPCFYVPYAFHSNDVQQTSAGFDIRTESIVNVTNFDQKLNEDDEFVNRLTK